MTQTIIGVFNSFDGANAAIAKLASQGLATRITEELSVLWELAGKIKVSAVFSFLK